MTHKFILGADPGSASGGFALYGMGDDDWEPRLYDLFPLPTVKSKGRGNEISIIELQEKLSKLTWQHAFIEQVSARPMEGRGSGFKFGVGCGIIQGLIIGRGIPYTMVPPAVWKKAIGLNTDKEFSRTRALQLFPEMSSHLSKKKDHNVAEAALLSYYGYMKLEGRLR